MRKAFILIPLIALAACAEGTGERYLVMKKITPPQDNKIVHCHGYGCAKRQDITLPPSLEHNIKNIFNKTSNTPEQERQKLARAIQTFEKDVGKLTDTHTDKGGTFKALIDDNAEGRQLDCVDESTNTTTYLTYLENNGFLKHHITVFPVNRQPFLNGARWWHQSAAILQTTTGEKFIVDSWYKDNGEKPYIVPYPTWKKGHDPSWDNLY